MYYREIPDAERDMQRQMEDGFRVVHRTVKDAARLQQEPPVIAAGCESTYGGSHREVRIK